MISNIRYKNFKAFSELNIDLAPITLFLGPNNSGKSSILSGIRILNQTLNSTDPNVSMLLRGKNGDFGTYKDIVFGNSTKRHMEIGISVMPKKPIYKIDLDLKYKYRPKRQEIIAKNIYFKDNRQCMSMSYSEDSDKFLLDVISNVEVPASIKATVSKGLLVDNFIPVFRSRRYYGDDEITQTQRFLDELNMKKLMFLNRHSENMRQELRNIEYIGAMRIPPQRTFMYTGENRKFVGSSGEHSVNILAMDTLRKGNKSKSIKHKVEQWLNAADIASELVIHRISDRHFELKIRNKETGELENYADVGYGNSQILPVLVAGYNLDEGKAIIIEEPEIHLHPKAQFCIGDYLKDLYNQGVQSLVETHSEHLIIRMQQLIAAKELAPEDVAIYYIWPEGTTKHIKRINMDLQGQFINEWPRGFFPERYKAAKDLSRIRYGVL
ncbi:hypothetical protein SANA_25350 [Gottschalkiaceae bacterium SANA]|nr:hypothetical protein SANA_25350 [Gottschalkiaceae bacterium SANA]